MSYLVMAGWRTVLFGWGWAFSSFGLAGHSAHNNIPFSYIEMPVWCVSAPRQIFAVFKALVDIKLSHDVRCSAPCSTELDVHGALALFGTVVIHYRNTSWLV